MKKILCSLFMAAAALAFGDELRLAEDGKTDYTIICEKTGVGRLNAAVKDFAGTLKKITGARFPVKTEAAGPRIPWAALCGGAWHRICSECSPGRQGPWGRVQSVLVREPADSQPHQGTLCWRALRVTWSTLLI